ncbi:MAG: hypothetical protein ACW990_14630, partial [Promethearchaeota archaeon]
TWARPATAICGLGQIVRLIDNNAQLGTPGTCWIDTSGIITLRKDALATAFTASSVCGLNVANSWSYYVGTGS